MPSTAKAHALAFAACLRTHGIPAPDPTFTPNTATIFFPPSIDPKSSVFQSASADCMRSVAGR